VNFCEDMVVASVKSMRHMRAIHDELQWVHKRKKAKSDKHLSISGEDGTFWSAMDLGNIVVHLFYGSAREYYDIESLWTLGPEADPKCREQEDPYSLSAEDLFWLETSDMDTNNNNNNTATEGGHREHSEHHSAKVQHLTDFNNGDKTTRNPVTK